ncbi:hypothetical protein ACFYXM_16230 [Streptomyces sp. NPDC002476]|uniref:hypothetical protein n=1 Tax=Streptomyces sp. NPDC002476 TaxID=3364648 RepID=UPI00369E6FC7
MEGPPREHPIGPVNTDPVAVNIRSRRVNTDPPPVNTDPAPALDQPTRSEQYEMEGLAA